MMRRVASATAVLVAAVPAAAAAVGAEERPPFSKDDVYRFVSVEDPAFETGGEAILYAATTTDRKGDTTWSDVWRVPYRGGAAVNLTKTDDRDEWAPKAAPDGRIYFLSNGARNGVTEIFRAPRRGGPGRRLTDFEGEVLDYAPSPDGTRLFAVVRIGAPKDNEAGASPPIVVDRYVAKIDGRGFVGPGLRQLFLVDARTGASEQLTDFGDDVLAPQWSPDGKRIAFVSRDGRQPDRDMNYDVFVIDAKKGAKPRKVTQAPTTDGDPDWGGPHWSPDGAKIVYARTDWTAHGPYAQSRLAVVDIAAGGEREIPGGDQWRYAPQWTPDGAGILALVETPESVRLAAINPVDGAATFLTPDRATAYDFAASAGGQIAVLRGDKLHPNEVFSVEGAALTAHNAWTNDRVQPGLRDVVYKSGDGAVIRGLMMTPPGWRKGPTPTLFALHGGPVWQWQHEFDLAWQTYAAAGFVVIGVNPRGSSGRGQAFAKALWRDWGGVEVRDVKAGVDWAIAEGVADPARLGVYGWSWGGILTNYMIASDPRFAAAISGAGMGNFLAAYGTDQYAVYYDVELGAPFENPELWRKLSYPFFEARRIRTPTLYQCADDDDNVPCLGALQMYSALRRTGVPTRLVVFPDETHSLSRPSYLEKEIDMNIAWFRQWMAPKPSLKP